jgi:hypothetical protein
MDDVASRNATQAEYEVRVLSGGVELEVTGPIGHGLTNEVLTALDANPGVSLIHLNSKGGRVLEARKLRDLILERHLSTYTGSECFSACVIAYAAGARRLIDPTAKLGLHQYAGQKAADLEYQYDIDRRFLLARGVSKAFVERAFKTPNTAVWIPSHRELLDAKLVTGLAVEVRARQPVPSLYAAEAKVPKPGAHTKPHVLCCEPDDLAGWNANPARGQDAVLHGF